MSQACDKSVHFHTIRYDRIPEAFGESSLHVPGFSDAWIQIVRGTPLGARSFMSGAKLRTNAIIT